MSENVNPGYEPDIKICPLCDLEVDCKARPKVFTVWKGKEVHYRCLDELIRHGETIFHRRRG